MHPVYQPRVDGWSCNPGDRGKNDRAQVRGPKSGPAERSTQRFLPELLRNFNPMVIGLAPGLEAVILFDRQSQMTRLDAHARLQPFHERGIVHLGAPMALERRQQDTLIIFVWWECACDAGDCHVVLIFYLRWASS